MEETIFRLVEERGPQTGAELRGALGDDGFAQWKTCMRSERLEVRRVGRRYLRLDQKVDGYARLSPSILREFLTYSVVGLTADAGPLAARAERLAAHIQAISTAKLKLVERIVTGIGSRLVDEGEREEDRFCVLVAGDIVYGMGHDSARPEHSTGRMVRGSDLDLVIIMADDAPEDLKERLDDAIYQEKYRHLIHPSFREEIDYAIKPLARVREQAAFETFRDMVPCKILDEAVFVYGSRALYDAAKALLVERDISGALAAMERSAIVARDEAEEHLLNRDEGALLGGDLYLFRTSEETEEFE